MAAKISDVAKCAGVGIGTVSRVLNGGKSVKDDKQQAVMRAVRELNYKPNSMAKRLREQKNGVIALMVPVVNHPFFAQFIDCVDQEADKFGYSTLLVASQQHAEREDKILDRIGRREVDGAIFVTHHNHASERFDSYPIVSVDRHLSENVPYITSDNYEATKRAIEYLIERGCKKIGYIGTKPLVESEVLLREKAYRDAMREHGMTEYIVNEVAVHGDETKLADKFFESFADLDGVFASGYSTAQCAYKAAVQAGKSIPENLQMIAYDGSFTQWSGLSMTCVQQPIEQMAKSAVKILMERINGKPVAVRTVHESSLIIGNTTK